MMADFDLDSVKPFSHSLSHHTKCERVQHKHIWLNVHEYKHKVLMCVFVRAGDFIRIENSHVIPLKGYLRCCLVQFFFFIFSKSSDYEMA